MPHGQFCAAVAWPRGSGNLEGLRVNASTFPMKTSESIRVLSLHEWGEVVTRKKKKITHDSS